MAASPPHAVAAPLLHLLVLCFSLLLCSSSGRQVRTNLTLASVRDVLIREEDTIVFCLIERAAHPANSLAYGAGSFRGFGGDDRPLIEVFVRQSEKVQAKAGRYENPEEIPFFPDGLPSLHAATLHKFPEFLHPSATSVNVSKAIWNMYLHKLLPLFVAKGDDGNYATTAASDLACLQALSKRIHYGRFVAEVKYRGAPEEYEPAIRSQRREALMKLLTNKRVEEAVKRRVRKKAETFGQNITLDDSFKFKNEEGNSTTTYKVDPSVAYRLYKEWVIPLTKLVEVKYLLHRLD